MASREPTASSSPVQPDQLLALALSRPRDASTAARSVLAERPDAYDASLAHHALGIVLRDHGDLPAAIGELRTASRLARASGRVEREVDVHATLGVTLAWAGRSKDGLAVLDEAVARSRGGLAGRVLMRRASVLRDLCRFEQAHDDLSRALALMRRSGDTVWEARSLMHRAEVYLGLGLPARAGADFARAEELFATSGQDLEYAKARHNRGQAALVRGDVPEALSYLDEAGRRYDALGETNPDLAFDRCTALLAAGLAREAMREADAALAQLPQGRGIAYKNAELLLAAATAALAAQDPGAARVRARRARRLFHAQQRELWELRAWFVLAQAEYGAGVRSARLLADIEQLAERLDGLGPADGQRAHLLAGRLALDRGQLVEADTHLEQAARARRHRTAVVRSVACLAQALRAEARGDRRGTVSSCARGLNALDEHLMSLGATELRAHATTHGVELAQLAQREMLRRGDTRGLLWWSERWRAIALAPRVTAAHQDQELTSDLSALRVVTRLLEEDGATEGRRTALERERRRLEDDVRARSRRARSGSAGGSAAGSARNSAPEPALGGGPATALARFDLATLVDQLGDTTLVELIEVDGVLHVVTVVGRRVRQHTLGAVPHREVEMARFTLRRLAYGFAPQRDAAALDAEGLLLEQVLLGPAVADLGDGPVVVVPTGRVQAVPWTTLPSLRDRVVSVMPSAATWLRARLRKPPPRRDVTLVVGPGLASGGAEVRQLGARYPTATMLRDGAATAEAVLGSLDGVWLAHVAAHGRFRADNPLFSSLQLDDGPLTVHDFERLRRAPHQLVLSSCDSGVATPVGADELLGLVSALVPLGAAGIVASIVPVNDAAVVPLMLALHEALGQGRTLPEALLAARTAGGDDPLVAATAHSFVALGA